MTKTSHTPGPLTTATKIAVTFQTSGAKRMVYPVCKDDKYQYENIGFAFTEADAHIFSMASDLLEALNQINQTIYAQGVILGSDDYFKIRTLCCDALAKARGR